MKTPNAEKPIKHFHHEARSLLPTRRNVVVTILLSLLIILVAPAASASNSCLETYEANLEAKVANGGHRLQFPLTGLGAFDSADMQIEHVTLTLVARGHDVDLKKIKFALNGVLAVGRENKDIRDLIHAFLKRLDREDGLREWWLDQARDYRHYHQCDRDGDRDRERDHDRRWHRHGHHHKDDVFVVSFDLSELLLNARDQFLPYFKRLIHNKGAMDITVQGHVNILSARILVTGSRQGSCLPTPNPTPTPTPTPVPVAPSTVIDFVSPSASPTSSTMLSLEFSSNQSSVSFSCALDGGMSELCSSPKIYSGLGNGSHSVTVVATNSLGMTDLVGATYAWSVDSTPPDVVLGTITPAASVTNSSAISVEFTSAEAATFDCALDGGLYEPCSSPLAYTGLMQGIHSIDIMSSDVAGNTSLAPAHYQWNIDQNAPVAMITQVDPAATLTNRTDAIFTFGANESATFDCSLDGSVYQTCVSPLSLPGLSEGPHAFNVRATDIAGNPSQPAGYSWSVDQASPVVQFGNVVPAQGATNSRNLSVEFFANEAASFSCAVDGGVAVACLSPFTAAVSSDGAHSMVVVGTDLAGNVSAAAIATWTMDFTSPQISFGLISPSAASFINSSTLSVGVNATEPVTFTAKLDDVFLGQTAQPIELMNLTEGFHSLVLDAYDGAGNPANAIIHNFVVDLTAPVVRIDGTTVPGITNQTSNIFSISASEQVSFECNLNGAGFVACANPHNVGGLIEGNHTLQLRGTDLAGNVSAVVPFSWTVDLTAPDTQITAASPSGAGVSIEFSVSEPSNADCSIDGAAFSACGSPFVVTGLGDGSHSVQVRATDAAGNIEISPASYGFTVDTQPPTVSLSANISSQTGSRSVQFSFSASEPGSLGCTFDGAPVAGCVSPLSLMSLVDGPHVFTVTAWDVAGNASAPADFNWTIDTTPPVTSLTAAQAAENSPNITFTLLSSKVNSTFQCALDGAAFTACNTPVSYGNLTSGLHQFTARAIDSLGNIDFVGISHSFMVEVPLSTTIISTTPATSPTSSNSISLSFTANDATATFDCRLDAGAAAACSSPMTYSGLVSGSHVVQIRAIRGSTVDLIGASYSWQIDTAIPTVMTVSTSVTSTGATINWTTNKPTTTALFWGMGTDTSNAVAEDSLYSKSHSVTLTGLSPNTNYSFKPAGHDQVGNFMLSSRRVFKTAP